MKIDPGNSCPISQRVQNRTVRNANERLRIGNVHGMSEYIFKAKNLIPKVTSKNLINILNEDGLNIKFIKCGSDSRITQEREQWTDGANAFTLSPGKIIGYDCNIYTLKELEKNGVIIEDKQEETIWKYK